MRNGLSWLMGIRPSSLVKPEVTFTWLIKPQPDNNNRKSGLSVLQTTPRQGTPETEIVVRTVRQGPPETVAVTKGRTPTNLALEEGWPSIEQKRCRKGHRRCRTPRHQKFGYQITDLDDFLSKASLETPGNIPVVLSTPCLLYQTSAGGHQEELSLPLGMVVNAVFKNRSWLYVQTPHGEEGYVRYAACLPLGILPPPPDSPSTAVWESQSDVFPKPTGNRPCSEEQRTGTRSESGSRAGQRYRAARECGEESVDSLYLAAQEKARRQVLLVIGSDYAGKGRNTLSVCKGEVVTLISPSLRDWFWVRARDGREGFIPAAVAGHGFL